MITRSSLFLSIALTVLYSANIVSCKAVTDGNFSPANEYEPPIQQHSIGSVSLKSVYYRAANTYNIENKLQRFELPSFHSSSTSKKAPFNLKSVKGKAYRPSAQFLDKAYELGRQKKPLRFEPSSFQAQEFLQPEPYILPDVTDSDTMLAFGEISYNAYTKLGSDKDWYDLGEEWGVVSCFFCYS